MQARTHLRTRACAKNPIVPAWIDAVFNVRIKKIYVCPVCELSGVMWMRGRMNSKPQTWWAKEAKRNETFFDMYLIKNYTCYRIAFWSSFSSLDRYVQRFTLCVCDVCLYFLLSHLCSVSAVSILLTAHIQCKKCRQKWCFTLTLHSIPLYASVCSTLVQEARKKSPEWPFLINNKVFFFNIRNWSNAIDQVL